MRALVRVLSVLAALAVLLGGARAFADDRALQERLLDQAAAAERAFDPRGAVRLYDEAERAAPTSRRASHARARRSWLTARAEGDFGPLVELLRVQRLGPAEDPGAISTFEAKLPSFPDGIVRREGRALVAEAWLGRYAAPERAFAACEAWLAEPGLDGAERALAIAGLARASDDLGRPDEAVRILSEAGLLDRPEAALVRARALGSAGRPVALASLLAFVLAGLWASRGAPARGAMKSAFRGLLRLDRALFLALLAVPPALLVGLYVGTRVLTLQVLAVGLSAGSVCVCAWLFAALAEPAPPRPRERFVLAILASMAALGAVFLALDRSGLVLELLLATRPR